MSSASICQKSKFQEVIKKDCLTVVKFSASWCGPCRAIAHQYRQMEEEYPEVQFMTIDVDECPKRSNKYQIRSVPTFIFFRKGEIQGRVTGASLNAVQKKIQENI